RLAFPVGVALLARWMWSGSFAHHHAPQYVPCRAARMRWMPCPGGALGTADPTGPSMGNWWAERHCRMHRHAAAAPEGSGSVATGGAMTAQLSAEPVVPVEKWKNRPGGACDALCAGSWRW